MALFIPPHDCPARLRILRQMTADLIETKEVRVISAMMRTSPTVFLIPRRPGRASRRLSCALATFAFSASLGTTPLAIAQAVGPVADKSSSGKTVSVHLDPAQTKVTFTAGTIQHVHGSFQLKGGVFAFDSTSGVAQGEILVDAESEKSNDAKLDKKIRTETLNVATYPGISFHPETVIGKLPAQDGTYHFQLKGTLTIHGTDHPLTVDVDATETNEQVAFKSTFSVPYVQWGMKDASTFFMRDRDIRVTIDSHGIAERTKPAS